MTVNYNALITCPHLQEEIDTFISQLKENGITVHCPSVVQQLDENDLLPIIGNYDGVIAGDDHFTSGVLHKAERLKILIKWGIGMDGIDLDTAKELGIKVKNTPHTLSDEVSDVVIGYIILLARQLHKIDREIRKGKWPNISGITLRDKILGIIGVGSIGKALTIKAQALGMKVIGYDKVSIPPSFIKKTGIVQTDLKDLLRSSDFISVNSSLSNENYHMLGSDEFKTMKKGAYIINTSRGALIDEEALTSALKNGKIGGAALDVFESEPLPHDNELLNIENCILGSHNSSNTVEARSRINEIAIRLLIEGLLDEK